MSFSATAQMKQLRSGKKSGRRLGDFFARPPSDMQRAFSQAVFCSGGIYLPLRLTVILLLERLSGHRAKKTFRTETRFSLIKNTINSRRNRQKKCLINFAPSWLKKTSDNYGIEEISEGIVRPFLTHKMNLKEIFSQSVASRGGKNC